MAFKESETLELKKSTSELKDATISIASILNKHQKGEIYFRIKNDGTIVGQDVKDTEKVGERLVDGLVEKGVDRGVEKLSEKENIILRLIKEDPNISKQEISIKGELTKKSVEYNITLLKKKGLLRRIGADRDGHWEVVG